MFIPQISNVTIIDSLLLAAYDGQTLTDIDPRTVEYARTAAEDLGLMNGWFLTSLGVDVLLDPSLLAGLVKNHPAVQALAESEEVFFALCEAAGLNETTAERRLSTAYAWMEFAGLPVKLRETRETATVCSGCFVALPLAIPENCDVCGQETA